MGIEAAIIGGALIGAGASLYASEQQRRSLEKAQQQEIDFARERLDYYKEIFGDIEQNLKKLYQRIGSPEFIAEAFQSVEKQYQGLEKRLTQALAQRGLLDSGLRARVLQNLALDKARARALATNLAKKQAREELMRFVGLGRGVIVPAEASLQSALGRQTALQGQLYAQSLQDVRAGFSGLGEALGYLYLSNLMRQRSTQPALELTYRPYTPFEDRISQALSQPLRSGLGG